MTLAQEKFSSTMLKIALKITNLGFSSSSNEFLYSDLTLLKKCMITDLHLIIIRRILDEIFVACSHIQACELDKH